MYTLNEAAKDYASNLNLSLEARINTSREDFEKSFKAGAEWMEAQMQSKIDELSRHKINLNKEIERLDQQLVDDGLKAPFTLNNYHSRNS